MTNDKKTRNTRIAVVAIIALALCGGGMYVHHEHNASQGDTETVFHRVTKKRENDSVDKIREHIESYGPLSTVNQKFNLGVGKTMNQEVLYIKPQSPKTLADGYSRAMPMAKQLWTKEHSYLEKKHCTLTANGKPMQVYVDLLIPTKSTKDSQSIDQIDKYYSMGKTSTDSAKITSTSHKLVTTGSDPSDE